MSVAVIACADGLAGVDALGDGVALADRLCAEPGRLGLLLTDATRSVLVLHRGMYALAEVQQHVRLAGIDPLGVQIVDIEDGVDTDDLVRRIAGAAARAAVFSGSLVEQAKPTFPRSMSRRGFLKPTPEYVAVPLVDRATCVAADGCRACVDICPRTAYSVRDGRVMYDKGACEPCGRCITGCPAGAIESPAAIPHGIDAQIRALVSLDARPTAVFFVCARGTAGSSVPGWFSIEVPCTGMLPCHWLLAPLLLGANRVAAIPCAESGCVLGHDETLAAAVNLSGRLLESFGFDPDAVSTSIRPYAEAAAMGPTDLADPFGTHGAREVMLNLAAAGTVTAPSPVADPSAPCGVVAVDGATCTMCRACAETCPTDALAVASRDGQLDLSFDPALCVACGQCEPVCPELQRGAIRLRPVVDIGELSAGRRVINTADVLLCEVCGDPVAPAAMMDRIVGLLGEEHSLTSHYLQRRCMNCRGM